jgi:hypothetical protein
MGASIRRRGRGRAAHSGEGTLGRRPGARGVHAKIVSCPPISGRLPALAARAPPHKIRTMDIERINAIGNNLADLSERTAALRGYL